MVSFHRIPYAEVYARSRKQITIVEELMKNLNQVRDLDMKRATELMADYKV